MSETVSRAGRHTAARHVGEAKARARHRAPEPMTSPENILPLTGAIPMVKERRAAIELERRLMREAVPAPTASPNTRAGAVAVTTGLIFIGSMSGAVAGTAKAEAERAQAPDTGSTIVLEANDPLITAPDVVVKHPKVSVETTPAPPPPAPAPKPVTVAPKPAAPAPVAPAPAPPPAPAPAPAPKVATPQPVPVPGSKAPAIAIAALAQLGRNQDCTRLVSNSLLAVGINFHDWPAGYLSLGPTVSAAAAVPGDLIYYANGGTGVAHIAVYIGKGMAVHGGWNGYQTVTFSANIGSGPVFIRVL